MTTLFYYHNLNSMNQFSVFNYTHLPQRHKTDFNKLLSNKFSNHIDEINNDDVLRIVGINAMKSDLEDSVVTELYCRVASGTGGKWKSKTICSCAEFLF